jgi:hypothetical protein
MEAKELEIKMYKEYMLEEKFSTLMVEEILVYMLEKQTISWLELNAITKFMPKTGQHFTAYFIGKILEREKRRLEDHSI